MKKILTAAALLAALLLTGCNAADTKSDSSTSSSAPAETQTLTASEKAEKLLAEVEFSGEMIQPEEENMEFTLGFTTDGLTEYAVYICGSGAYPDEFGIFTAETAEKADEIKKALEQRVKTMKSTYESYTPDEMYKFEDSFVKQHGTTVYYAVTADNSTAAEILG